MPKCSYSSSNGAGRAEVPHADKSSVRAQVLLPALHDAGLDAHAGGDGGRQDRVAIGGVLHVEQFKTGQADDPRGDALGGQHLLGGEADADFAARADQDDLRRARGRIEQHVAATRHAGGRAHIASGRAWGHSAA